MKARGRVSRTRDKPMGRMTPRDRALTQRLLVKNRDAVRIHEGREYRVWTLRSEFLLQDLSLLFQENWLCLTLKFRV